jgi:hypothetical protein
MKITLKKTTVDDIFAKATHQVEYILGLYKAAYAVADIDFDAIKSVDGFPKIAHDGNLYITGLAIEFDKRVHPGIFAGAAWAMGRGFDSDHGLRAFKNGGWEVELAPVVY